MSSFLILGIRLGPCLPQLWPGMKSWVRCKKKGINARALCTCHASLRDPSQSLTVLEGLTRNCPETPQWTCDSPNMVQMSYIPTPYQVTAPSDQLAQLYNLTESKQKKELQRTRTQKCSVSDRNSSSCLLGLETSDPSNGSKAVACSLLAPSSSQSRGDPEGCH